MEIMKLITPLNDEWSFCGENLTKERASRAKRELGNRSYSTHMEQS